MSYQLLSAPLIFDGYQLHQNAALVIGPGGTIETLIQKEDAGDNVERFEGILCPGFVNCHCHLELSHMRGLIPQHTGLVDFVFKVVTQRHFSNEDILLAIELAEDEMLRNGIVAVGDICNTAHTAGAKAKQRLLYYNFVEVSGWLPEVAQTRLTNSLEVYNLLSLGDKEQVALVPHAPYSVSEKLWLLLQPFFKDKTVSIHNQETSFEDELFVQGGGDFMRMYNLMKMDSSFFFPSGKSSLQTYFSKLNGARNVMLVHNTFTKEADVVYARERAAANRQQLFFCLCANANLYIENALPPVQMLMQQECTIVLGTDSLASNHSLNMLDEMRTIKQHFPQVSIEQLLRCATINGATALNLHERLGSFEKGKQPGVLLINEQLDMVKRLV